MKHVIKKIMTGSSLLLALMFSLTVHAENTTFENVEIKTLKATHTPSSTTLYHITWLDGTTTCEGYSGDPEIISMLKIAYLLNKKVTYLHAGCNNGDIIQIDI
ncbi:hypothetical protein GWQ31_00265 [Aeromonas sp. 2MA4]|uniref:hypothetical protein n=1 Tax=Aeromonas sp. 2MA4 TaxID=2699195 RepID=UPI0023DDB6A4|nr:hypothetical protein [Aeromonas sp. 2MA4]MDF2389801.1 hypothetical protein [Aeromonas sp. 2MA4]